LGERPLLYGPISACLDGFGKLGAKMASIYTFPSPDPAVKTEDRTIEDGLKVRIYTPGGYNGAKPVGVYFHGGGWAMGDLDGDDAFCRSISKGGGVVLVSVEYGLAPQNKHPGLVNDCYKGLRWTLQNAKDLGGIEGKIFTSGVSAGGGLALGVALKAIDEGLGGALVGVIAQVPATIHPDAVPSELKSRYNSMDEHKDHTINTASAMNAFWGQ
jgi:versiconal hemiacetal acetate esterase